MALAPLSLSYVFNNSVVYFGAWSAVIEVDGIPGHTRLYAQQLALVTQEHITMVACISTPRFSLYDELLKYLLVTGYKYTE